MGAMLSVTSLAPAAKFIVLRYSAPKSRGPGPGRQGITFRYGASPQPPARWTDEVDMSAAAPCRHDGALRDEAPVT